MEREWYSLKEMQARGYSRGRLLDMYHAPGQRYARKKNPTKRNSPIEFNLKKLIEAEERDVDMQASSRERRVSLA
ncbi:MAG: hypothetical protein QM793_03475 [Muricomes sp.]